MSTSATGRRAAVPRRRSVVTRLVVAVALPSVTVGVLALVRTGAEDAPATRPPELVALTRVALGCPESHGDARRVLVGSSAEQDGEVSVHPLGRDSEPRGLGVAAGRVRSTTLPGAVVVAAEDAWAPGLLARRTGRGAAAGCQAPAPQAWFTGLGARPAHASVVELINPDRGPAIADLTVLAPSGPLDVPDVRGLRVPGRSSVELHLARIIPRRTELAVQLRVSRGRLVSSVWDTVERLGRTPAVGDWVVPQAEAATSGILLGLPAGRGSRRLSLANGGPDETRVEIRVVAPESVFAPRGIEEIRLAPGAVRSISLDRVLAREVAAGAAGLLIEASDPVTASVRSLVDGDLATTVVSAPVRRRAAAVLPTGRARLVLAGADAPGVATVASYGATGRELEKRRVEVGPERSVTVRLPDGTARVALELDRTEAVAALVVEGSGGAVVLPLQETVLSAPVPDVRPEAGGG